MIIHYRIQLFGTADSPSTTAQQQCRRNMSGKYHDVSSLVSSSLQWNQFGCPSFFECVVGLPRNAPHGAIKQKTQQTSQKCISTPNNDFISLARRLLMSSLTLLVFFTPSCSSTSSHFLVLKSYSNRLGPLHDTFYTYSYLIGEDHQICLFGLCLLIT